MFNRATLATYNDVCRRISETSINFSWSAFVENVSDNKQTFYMDAETRKAIKNEVAIQKKKDFTERYRFEIEGTKQDLIDKLPSLRKQLEEQEELRRTNAAEAARIEEERKQQEAEERKKQEEERKRRKKRLRPNRLQKSLLPKYRQHLISQQPACPLLQRKPRSRRRSR